MLERVVIVEDHSLFAEAVGLTLNADGFDVRVAPLVDRSSLLDAVSQTAPCLAMLDLDLGDLGDGTELVPVLRERGADVLVVTGSRERVRLAAAVAAGAVGYLRKDESLDTLVAVVRRACAGEPVIEANERQRMLACWRRTRAETKAALAPFESLTPREWNVLAALIAGKSVDTIASEWFVSTATVRTQVRGVLTKLDVKSQLAAVAKAKRVGWPTR